MPDRYLFGVLAHFGHAIALMMSLHHANTSQIAFP